MSVFRFSGRTLLAVLCLGSGVGTISPAVSATVTMTSPVTIGERITLQSEVMGESREILVRVPWDYERAKRRYPVLYVLDGTMQFAHAASTVEFLARDGRIPEMIVVGIPAMQARGRDLIPPRKDDPEAPVDGYGAPIHRAADFLRFLADELVPWVDTHYRTEPFRILNGHSYGGLFNFYSLLERPEVFKAHVATSPSLWFNQQSWLEQVQARIGAVPGKHWLYFSWGDQESPIQVPSQKLVDWMRDREAHQPFANLAWKAQYYPGEGHGTTPLKTLYDGLAWVFKDWPRPLGDVDFGMLRHPTERGQNDGVLQRMTYEQLDRRIAVHHVDRGGYGFAIGPDAAAGRWRRSWLRAHGRHDEALAQARAALDAYPELVAGLREEISDILDTQGHAVEALAEYEKAMAEYRRNPPPEWLEYGMPAAERHRLEELRRKAAAGVSDSRSSDG